MTRRSTIHPVLAALCLTLLLATPSPASSSEAAEIAADERLRCTLAVRR